MPSPPAPASEGLIAQLRALAAMYESYPAVADALRATAHALVSQAEQLAALTRERGEAEAQAKAFDELYTQEQKVLARIATALGVQLDWHCEPFPHEEETLARIAALIQDASDSHGAWEEERAKAETAEAQRDTLRSALQEIADLQYDRYDAETGGVSEHQEIARAALASLPAPAPKDQP